MKSIAVCLILIGSLALAAVLSLSIFFILRPRTRTTTTYYFGVPKTQRSQQQLYAAGVTEDPYSKSTDAVTTTEKPTTQEPSTTIRPTTTTPSTTQPTTTKAVNAAGFFNNMQRAQTRGSRVKTTQRTLAPVPLTQPRRLANLNQEWLVIDVKPQSTAVAQNRQLPNLNKAADRVKPNSGNLLVLNSPQQENQNDILSDYAVAVDYKEPTQALTFIREVSMAKYGKVVGLGYRDNYLYVPSHRQGNISVLSIPDLRLVEEIPCPKCRIYDLGILPSGDLIVAQGARKRLAKIDRASKQISKELTLPYSTKGVAVTESGEIFVLSRSHDKIYQYDTDLNEVGVIEFTNNNEDCNFLVANSPQNELFISCQNQVHVIDLDGNTIGSLKPRRGGAVTYSVGIQREEATGFVMVIRRGKAQIDIYGLDGELRETLGADEDTLWSDMVVADRHAYVVDYINASIRMYAF